MHKSLGIVTHYYNSTNYGGVLQSYALCKYLNDSGVAAKQVCYNSLSEPFSAVKNVKKNLIYSKRFLDAIVHPGTFEKIKLRKNAFKDFRNNIPHTDSVYTYKNIKSVDSEFDAFITGSDQVWHPAVINDAYSLRFTDKPKYAYAASIASNTIPPEKVGYYKDFLSSFEKVSVRERTARELLPANSQLVLDPVFLFSYEQWTEMASERLIDEPYVFCFFLGSSAEDRNNAIKFARDRNLKTVNIPYLKNYYRKCDDAPFDYSLSGISPNDFLSLILNSEYVLTDSFHAICFSYIFKKQFFAFDRKTKAKMSSRIADILYTLDLTERFFEKSDEIANEYGKIDYEKTSERFLALKNNSVDYIASIIRGLMNE